MITNVEFKKPVGLLLFLCLLDFSCEKKVPVQYLDEVRPGLVPELYAEEVINASKRFQQNLTLTADGSEHYFTETDAEEWRYLRILRVTQKEGEVLIDTPQFVRDFQFENVHFIGEPMLSPDGERLLFVADYPPNLWLSQRDPSGNWKAPKKLSISTTKADWYPSFQKDGSLLFTNGVAYLGKGESTLAKEELALPTYPFDVRDPILSPEKDFIIVTRWKDQSEKETDLFVSFAQPDGSWGTLLDLGSDINTDAYEFAPSLSPDGNYLFFSRRDQWQNAKAANVYWVSIQVVEALRKAGTNR